MSKQAAAATFLGVILFFLGAACVVSFSYLREGDARRLTAELEAREGKFGGERRDALRAQLNTIATSPSVTQALSELGAGYDAHIPQHLRDLYVELNPFRGADLSLADDMKDGSDYSKAHAVHHKWLRSMVTRNGYRDLFLIRPDGEVIYSTSKGSEFASSLNLSGNGGAGIDRAFHRALTDDKVVDVVTGVDATGQKVVVAAAQLVDLSGKLIGVVAVERSPWPVVDVGAVRAELGAGIAGARTKGLALTALFALLSAFGMLIVLRPAERGAVASANTETWTEERGPTVGMEFLADPPSNRSATRLTVSSSTSLNPEQPARPTFRGR